MTGYLDVDIELGDIEGFAEAMERAPELTIVELRQTTQRAMNIMEQVTTAETPVGVSGNLKDAWSFTVKGRPGAVTGEAANPLVYAYPVERGRQPGRPPPTAPIAMWLYRKGITDPKELRSAAFLVARAIGRRGTKGSAMLYQGFSRAELYFTEDLNKIPGRVFDRLARMS